MLPRRLWQAMVFGAVTNVECGKPFQNVGDRNILVKLLT